MTIAEALVPQAWRSSFPRRLAVEMFLVLGGSVLVALSARVRLDLPFTPVPITGQTFAVLLTGAALGARRGALSLLAYVVEGTAGLPVFAGGTCCLPVLLGPTGGYLLSYPFAAAVTGWLAERGWDRKPKATALAMLAGNIVIYLVGLPWLAIFVGKEVFIAGLLPFIPGDTFKLILATIALPVAWKVVGQLRSLEE
jgi:biotin transport system substrate-specific component